MTKREPVSLICNLKSSDTIILRVQEGESIISAPQVICIFAGLDGIGWDL